MTAEEISGRYFQDIDSEESNHPNQVIESILDNAGDTVGKGTSMLSGQEIPGQCTKDNDGFNLVDKATDTNGNPSKDSEHTDDVENLTFDKPDGIFDNVEVNTVAEGNDTYGHPSQESVVIVEAENSAIDGLGIIHDSSKTIDTNVEQIESIVGFDGECDDVLQKELPVQSVHESEEINTVHKAIDVNGDPNKDSDHTNVAENMAVEDSILSFNNVEVSTVAEENNVHDVCVQEITLNDGYNEQTTSSADDEVEQNDVSQKNIQDFQHENVHNNDGMENTDETQGDVEQNNDSFLEGCSVILGEQNIVQDGVIVIEDKMTLLDFDNAEDQTSTPDEEFEWNDDSGVVSKDTKHMKKNRTRRTKKMLLLKMMMIEVLSLNYPQLCYNLKMH